MLATKKVAPITGKAIGSRLSMIQIKACSEIGKIELPSVRHDFFRPCRKGIMKDLDVQDLLRAIGSTPGSRSAAPPTPASSCRPAAGERLAIPLQFHRAVEKMEIWSANSDGYSFVISYESPNGPGFH